MQDFKYVYGPVPSRRMGISVGISPIPKGYCNYACIYCQLGRTKHMTNKRENFFDRNEIVNEFKQYLEGKPDFDVVTIVGEGEPSLYSDLGNLIRDLKELTDKPLAVITNGALLSEQELRQEMMEADIVLPSVDACDEFVYRKINRPNGKISFQKVTEGLKLFSNEFQGQLWIETMLARDVNDSLEYLQCMKEFLNEIQYSRLYINTPVRPPAESYVKEPSQDTIEKAVEILGGTSIDKLVSDGFHSEVSNDYDAVLSIIKRHPMNQFEIKAFINERGSTKPEEFFKRLDNDGNIEKINYKSYDTYRLM